MHRSPCIASNWCFNGAVCWKLQRVKWVSGWLLKAVMFHLAMNHVIRFWMDWQWKYCFSSAFIIKIQTKSLVICVIGIPTQQKTPQITTRSYISYFITLTSHDVLWQRTPFHQVITQSRVSIHFPDLLARCLSWLRTSYTSHLISLSFTSR